MPWRIGLARTSAERGRLAPHRQPDVREDGRVANMSVGVPQVPYTRVSEQQKEEIINA